MPLNPLPARRPRRGYMLLEALVAGALVATGLVGMMSAFADADRNMTASIREHQAVTALEDGLARAYVYSVANLPSTIATDYPPGCVDRAFVINTSISGCNACKAITVTVRYLNPQRQIRTLAVTTAVRTP